MTDVHCRFAFIDIYKLKVKLSVFNLNWRCGSVKKVRGTRHSFRCWKAIAHALAQCWERSPPTNAAQILFRTGHHARVGLVCRNEGNGDFSQMILLQQFSVLKVIQMQRYYTCANDSISRIPNMTRTVEWSFGVCTVSIFMAIVGVVDVMRSKTSFIALSYVFEKNWNKKWDQIHNWDFLSNSVYLPTHVTPSPE